MNDIYDTYPILFFGDTAAWETWLEANADTSLGVRLKFAKKTSGIPSMTYEGALEVALCFGWIDSRKNTFDDLYWLQVFSPRKVRSVWSKINQDKVVQLIALGKMRPSGIRTVEEARKNGQWDKAYASQATIGIPRDFQDELDENAAAAAFFNTLDSGNRYAVLYRIHMSKNPEARLKKIRLLVEMLEKNEKLHP